MDVKILQWYDNLIIFGFYAIPVVVVLWIIGFIYITYKGSKLKPMAQREKEHGEFQESLGEDFDNE